MSSFLSIVRKKFYTWCYDGSCANGPEGSEQSSDKVCRVTFFFTFFEKLLVSFPPPRHRRDIIAKHDIIRPSPAENRDFSAQTQSDTAISPGINRVGEGEGKGTKKIAIRAMMSCFLASGTARHVSHRPWDPLQKHQLFFS